MFEVFVNEKYCFDSHKLTHSQYDSEQSQIVTHSTHGQHRLGQPRTANVGCGVLPHETTLQSATVVQGDIQQPSAPRTLANAVENAL